MQETPGHCLALNGSAGAFVALSLREPLFVTAVTVEHLHRGVAFDTTSAVRAFALLRADGDDADANGDGSGGVLAQGVYDARAGPPVQTFGAAPGAAGRAVRAVRFAVRSNHGGGHTCLYRLRVHGRAAGAESH